MTPDPVTLRPDMTVGEALDVMFRKKHMGYPVTTGNELAGIVTFHDISEAARDVMVGDVMTTEVVTATEDEELTSVLEKMNRHQLGRLPVMGDGKLKGIISRTDIIRTLNLMRKGIE